MQLADRMSHLGTETAFEVLARANKLAAEGRDIINLGIGQPDFKTPDHIVEAGRQALADGHHGYTPANGIPASVRPWRRTSRNTAASPSIPTTSSSCPAASRPCSSPA